MIITKIKDITGDNVDWISMGARFQIIRESRNTTRIEACEELGFSINIIAGFEEGFISTTSGTRKSTNIIMMISNKWDLSLNWLINGIGKPHYTDPAELMPETLHVQKGAGINRDCSRTQAEEGHFSDETLEFIVAIDKFKVQNQVTFPSLTQIYDIITALGYRKSVPARIAPLGYAIKHQKHAEKLKQQNEKIENFPEKIDNPEFYSKIKMELLGTKRKSFPHEIETEKILWQKKMREEGKYFRPPTKKYNFTDPEGTNHITFSLTQFCKDHNLSRPSMYKVSQKTQSQYEGWKLTLTAEEAKIEFEEALKRKEEALKRKIAARQYIAKQRAKKEAIKKTKRIAAQKKKAEKKKEAEKLKRDSLLKQKLTLKFPKPKPKTKPPITGNPILDRIRQGLMNG